MHHCNGKTWWCELPQISNVWHDWSLQKITLYSRDFLGKLQIYPVDLYHNKFKKKFDLIAHICWNHLSTNQLKSICRKTMCSRIMRSREGMNDGGRGGDTLPLYRACKDHNNIDCILTDTNYHCFSLRGTRVHEWGWGRVQWRYNFSLFCPYLKAVVPSEDGNWGTL